MRSNRLAQWMAATGLCLAVGVVGAAPTVFARSGSILNTSGQTLTITLSFSEPFVGLGDYDLKLSMAGSFADGARDGASVAPTALSGHLTEFSFSTGQGMTALGGVGAASAFAGAGGAMGAVRLEGVTIDEVAGPTSFSFAFDSPPLSVGRVLSQGAVAGVGADGGTDGVAIGPPAGSALSRFGFLRSDGAQDLLDVNDSDASAGATASVLANGAQLFECEAAPACVAQHMELNLQMSGGNDAAAFVLRNEFGGDPITDTVIDLIDEETALTSFSCAAAGGCSGLNSILSLTLSAGDLMAFVIRMEIDDAAASVPAPGGLASMLLVSVAAGLARRPRRR